MEAAVERSNMLCAYERVAKNEGAPGVDGLTVSEFKPWLQAHWPSVRQALLAGEYMPAAVRKVEIPKPEGGVRHSGHPDGAGPSDPTGPAQVLQPLFDPEFSERASASGRDAAHTRPFRRRGATSRRASDGWWTWTWRSSSTG